MIEGIYTALVTPFDAEGHVNIEVLDALLTLQIEAGVDGVVALGTTGEAPTLLPHEKEQITRHCAKRCKGKVQLMVGTGAYSTLQTIENTKLAKECGADSVLVVTPFYNRPTQEGLLQHFTAVANGVDIPMVLYNHPGRTGQNIETTTIKKLAQIPSIVGVKDASGSITQMGDVIATLREQRPDFSIMSGDDSLLLPLMALGGDGVISVVGNLFPGLLRQMMNAIERNDVIAAQAIHYRLLPLLKALAVETNPAPIKYAMELSGMAVGGLRLPLCEVSAESKEKITEAVNTLFYSTQEALTR